MVSRSAWFLDAAAVQRKVTTVVEGIWRQQIAEEHRCCHPAFFDTSGERSLEICGHRPPAACAAADRRAAAAGGTTA